MHFPLCVGPSDNKYYVKSGRPSQSGRNTTPHLPPPPLYDARTHALVYMMFHTNNTIPLGILYPPLYIHSKKQMCLMDWEYARYIVCRRRPLTNFLSELFYIFFSYTRITTDNGYSAVRKSADPLTVFVLTQGICRRLRCFCFS